MKRSRKGLRHRYGHAGRISQPGEMRISKKSLATLMFPWGSDSGSGLPMYAVASFFFNNHVYPDRNMLIRAIEEAERTIPRAQAGAHGWTAKDARDLKRIAGGLRYWLRKDYP